MYPQHRTTPDGPDRNQANKLIGVELTFITPSGESEEIMMLVPHGGGYLLPKDPYGYSQMQVTLHTSDGDRTARIQL